MGLWEVEYLSEVKTAQNSRTGGGTERKKKQNKKQNVKLKEEDVPGTISLLEKP